ncbi:hypothetical protein [Mycobacterium seoulense]|uniref:hypothetical protein n=1 Tax=Mycobacterium seoulense TaxID=386911 RepID=UPI003CF9A9F3
MATSHPPGNPATGPHPTAGADSPLVDYDDEAPRVIRVRLAAWDVISTVALLAVLIVLATATTWPTRLFGFLEHVCADETCGPVPFGVDYYIRPLVWGGIGAAIAAAVVGPLVSVLKGWYMSFWPVLALTLIMVSSVAGSILTTFSERYWV